jgi:bacillithiol biosynthesis cysteine-adding enzyme BshC
MSLQFESTPVGPWPPLDYPALAGERARPLDPVLRDAFIAHGHAEQQLDRLFEPGSLCVTTGQQPGLFTGPLFTLYKALSAIALARKVEQAVQRPVVPVFWVAGDDHDLAEANHTYAVTAANEVRKLTLPGRAPEAPLTPMYRQLLGDGVTSLIDEMAEMTPPTEFREDVLGWLGRHYTPDNDFATAFAGAIGERLGPLGLVVLRPYHAAVKRVMRPLVLRVLDRARDIDRALAERAAQLRALDQPAPVAVGDGATPVMLESELGRDRLVSDGGAFQARRSGRRYHRDELHAIAEESPERFSPNVLLRPVIEAAILPTLAYVAGPSELAYLPQCAPLYELLDVPPQAAVPRWSGRVVETKIQKVLTKFQIGADDLGLPEGQLEQRLVRDEVPTEARGALAALRKSLELEYVRLKDAATGIDPTLKKPVESAQHAALAGTREVEKRILSHLKQKNAVLVQQLDKARQNLFPLAKPQERILNLVPYLLRYGDEFVGSALDAVTEGLDTLEPRPASP